VNLFVAFVCLASAVAEADVVAFSSTPADLLTIGRTAVPAAPTDRGLSFAIDTVDIDATTPATKNTWHTIYRIDDDDALADWGQLGIDWAPWSELRPVVRARVVTSAGREYTLDPSTLIDGQVGNTGGGVFSDRHRLQGPLPGAGRGAVVELEVVRTDIATRAMPFVFDRVVLGGWYPTVYARVSVVTPRAVPLQAVAHGVADSTRRRTFDDGPRRTTEFVLTAWPGAAKAWEPEQPDDIEDGALVSVSTASWAALASGYADIVARQLRGFDAAAQLAAWKIDVAAPVLVREQQIIDAVGSNIRYTGLHVGDAAITPATPAEVLARGYGDCKDLATLMTALLRAAGISADVALIRSSDGVVRSDVPGSSMFDHAIVAVRDAGKTTWIDATDPHAIATQTPSALQGKPALIAASSTKALTLLPTSRAADNTYREVRTIRFADEGAAHIVEETTATGTLGEWISARVHDRADERQKELKAYAVDTWSAAHVAIDELAISAAGPYRSTLTMTKAQRGFTNHNTAAVYVDGLAVVSWLPSALTRTDNDDDDDDDDEAPARSPRKRPLQLATTMQTHVQYRIVPPTGYELERLPPSAKRTWGPATYSEVWAREADAVVVDYDLVLDKRTLSAAEANELQTAIAAWAKTTSTLLQFPHRARARMTAGDPAGAIAAHRALLASHPSALEHERFAGRLLELHLGDAAQREARAAVALEPNRAAAHVMLAHTLMNDALGRWRGATANVDGAVAAARRALELEPRNTRALRLIADAIAFDAKGRTTTNLDAVREAITLLEATPVDDRPEQLRRSMLVLKLLAGAPTSSRDFSHLKHGTEVAALWPVLTTVPLNEMLTTFEAQTRPATRDAVRADAVGLLFATRHYQQSQALLAYTAQHTAESAIVGRAVPCEAVVVDDSTPEGFVRSLYRDATLGQPLAALRKRFVEFDRFSSLQALDNERTLAFATIPQGVSRSMICDVTINGFDAIVDGNDDDGFFVTLKARSVASQPTFVFLERDHDTFKVVSFGVQGGAVANAVRTRVARSPKSALRWLRWLDAVAPPTTFADPLDGDPARLLIRGTPNDDDIRLAVSTLGLAVPALRHDALREVSKRLADAQRPLPSQTRAVVQRMVAAALALEGRCRDLEPVLRDLAKVAPQSTYLELLDLQCAMNADDLPRVERLAMARHARLPDDRFAGGAVAGALLKQGRANDVVAYARAQTERNPSSASAWNQLAWFELVVGAQNPQDVLKHAEQAVSLSPAPGIKHTLALAQATAGDGVKALQTLTELQDSSDNSFDENQWVVIGRAAEALGMPRYALTAYIRAAGERLGEPDDSRAIAAAARQRLLAAGVEPLVTKH
jgi:hypothetical protein